MKEHIEGTFVHCPDCGRLMIGQKIGNAVYPQPHLCITDNTTEDE